MKKLSLILAFVFVSGPLHAATDTLISYGANWKFLDNGSNQGSAWRAIAFNDSAWATGPAQLGFGDGDEATVMASGHVTYYFRHTFNIVDASIYLDANLGIIRDDGAAVYLNGVEIYRNNLNPGANFSDLATATVAGADETTPQLASFDPSLLVNGTNVIAVEVHQVLASSSDVSFDFELTASDTPASAMATRGPYLQSAFDTGIIVRWRTNQPTDSRVRYGAAPGSLTSFTDVAGSTTEHEVQLTGLAPNTTYYYSIGSSAAEIGGNDANHFFVTSPPTGSGQPFRAWVLGDSGTGNTSARAVRDAYESWTGTIHTNMMIMLGDNAYSSGFDNEFQVGVFDTYPAMLRKSVLWSCIGNHETYNGLPTYPYYDIHTFPTGGEAGGLPSGTEAYYSYDYGNVHFVVLDSQEGDLANMGSTMNTWLAADLGATSQEWVVAMYHHGPYTKGSHDSDIESRHIAVRAGTMRILEDYGVDLTLSGHSHSYERSYLIDGHYGMSGTFNGGIHCADGGACGDGKPAGDGNYVKPPGITGHKGAIYVINGSSGKISGGALNHPAHYVSINQLGSVVLDFSGNRLDFKFLQSNQVVADSFTLIKGTPYTPTATFTVTPWAGTPTFTATVTPTSAPPTGIIIDDFDSAIQYSSIQNNDFGHWTDEDNSMISDTVVGGALSLNYNATGSYWYSVVGVAGVCYDASAFNALSFDVRGAAGGETFTVSLEEFAPGCTVKTPHPLAITSYTLVTSAWQTVVIPFADFGVNPALLSAVVLAGFTSQGTIEIDDIMLVAPPGSSPTPTLVNTATPGPSETFSPTMTLSATPTFSPTMTLSTSPTVTLTATTTRTLTPTSSETPTVTVSYTQVPIGSTFTWTPTVSTTATPSFTATVTFTPTLSSTTTYTATVTSTQTLSATGTHTWTFTTTYTPTSLNTPVNTATRTQTPADTPTRTLTAVSTATAISTGNYGGRNIVLAHYPVPNPNPRAFHVELDGLVDELEIRIYSRGMTQVGGFSLMAGPRVGWVEVLVPAGTFEQLASGLYYYRVLTLREGNLGKGKSAGRLMILH